MTANLKIGDSLYQSGTDAEYVITGETRQSWIVKHPILIHYIPFKVNKKTLQESQGRRMYPIQYYTDGR